MKSSISSSSGAVISSSTITITTGDLMSVSDDSEIHSEISDIIVNTGRGYLEDLRLVHQPYEGVVTFDDFMKRQAEIIKKIWDSEDLYRDQCIQLCLTTRVNVKCPICTTNVNHLGLHIDHDHPTFFAKCPYCEIKFRDPNQAPWHDKAIHVWHHVRMDHPEKLPRAQQETSVQQRELPSAAESPSTGEGEVREVRLVDDSGRRQQKKKRSCRRFVFL